MDRQLGFGFVGAGEIAVASAKALRASRHAFIARVHDLRDDLAQDLAIRYGGHPADSIETLLADPKVAAVYICVPHYLHRAAAVAAAEAGKHVFIEKPMGISPDDAQAIVDACRQNGVACGVPFVARYAPAYREAHRLVRSGAIGEVTGFRLTYRGDKPDSYWNGGYSQRAMSDWRQTWATAGGGVLIMNTIHDLDAMLWITGLDVAQVQGVIANTSSPGEVEDYALAILHCSGGVLGSLEAMSALPGGQGSAHHSVNRIYGRHGQIVLPSPWSSDPLALFTRETGQWREIAPAPSADARQLAFDDFAEAVLSGSPIPIPGQAGLKASHVLHAVYDAARRGECVAVAGGGTMVHTVTYDQLNVSVFDSVDALVASAADDLAAILRQALAEQSRAAVILATGNSQLAFYQKLQARDDIAWQRVTIFHMDEYLGLPEQHPASFRRVLQERLVDQIRPGAFYGIAGDAEDVAAEIERYVALLDAHQPVACVMGIGENGHLAFNDPPADFTTKRIADVVTLVESCRQQQVGEGHFAQLEDVPRQAISLTVPALLTPRHVLVIAPEARKAAAVRAALEDPITPDCPASILRTAPHARLYLDRDSAALLGAQGQPPPLR